MEFYSHIQIDSRILSLFGMIQFSCGIFKTKPGYNLGSFLYRYADRNSMARPYLSMNHPNQLFYFDTDSTNIGDLSRSHHQDLNTYKKNQKSDISKVLITNKT